MVTWSIVAFCAVSHILPESIDILKCYNSRIMQQINVLTSSVSKYCSMKNHTCEVVSSRRNWKPAGVMLGSDSPLSLQSKTAFKSHDVTRYSRSLDGGQNCIYQAAMYIYLLILLIFHQSNFTQPLFKVFNKKCQCLAVQLDAKP